MTINRFALAFVLALGTASAASGQSWNWIVSPTAPSAGDTMTVHVLSAPTPPITVEIWLDGRLVMTRQLTEIPGSVPYSIPASASGKVWEVRVLAGGGASGETKSGTVH